MENLSKSGKSLHHELEKVTNQNQEEGSSKPDSIHKILYGVGENVGVDKEKNQLNAERSKVYSSIALDTQYKESMLAELKQCTGIAWWKAIDALEGTKQNNFVNIDELEDYRQALSTLRAVVKPDKYARTIKNEKEAEEAIGIIRYYATRDIRLSSRDGIDKFEDIFGAIDKEITKSKIGLSPDAGKSDSVAESSVQGAFNRIINFHEAQGTLQSLLQTDKRSTLVGDSIQITSKIDLPRG